MNEPDIPAGNYQQNGVSSQQGYSRGQMQDYGWRMAEWAREADTALLRQALDALETHYNFTKQTKAIGALRDRLK